MNILLNDETKRQLDQFIEQAGHALGIFAPYGSGKFYTAQYIAATILGTEAVENNPNIFIVRPEKKASITIDQAREVVTFLKLKHSLGNTISRVVIIDNAATLTTEAQNALLKTLEEPPLDALIIMTSASKNNLLPTIVSRLKTITLKPVVKNVVLDFFIDQGSTKEIEKAYAISNGRLGLMSALLADDDHELIPSIESAKTFLGMNQYDRLAMLDQILKQDTDQFLEALQIVSDAAFKQSVLKIGAPQSKRWHKIRKSTALTRDSLSSNAHTKLALTNLILSV